MIKTSRQLKDLVRNLSGGSSIKAQIIIRNYIMERFLERVSLSKYKEHFIFKGGIMVSAIVGIDNRSTMDIDTTLKNISLSVQDIQNILENIISVEIDDGVTFDIKSVVEIMDEAEYPGVRASLDAKLENMRTPLKIDFSTGDAITPKEIEYSYKLMFEKRSISIFAYNIETILAEKMETVISRGTANTRLRDFYDLRILYDTAEIDYVRLKSAFAATCRRRNSEKLIDKAEKTLSQIKNDGEMKRLWENYQRKYDYAREYSWNDIMYVVCILFSKVK
ncbi:MAG: nucleotidyl transferase AbiEii/AbiGii toxin family protein [Acutalibacteraceae bacterium]